MIDDAWDASKREVRLWALDRSGPRPAAVPVTPVATTETESLLEDILVGHPDLLETGLQIIGRQVSTESGPLDLVGVDESGRLVIFELKRGTLARDAVAQTIDYASAIQGMDRDALAAHLQACSGRGGVDAIPDFNDWYNETYPDNNDEFAQRPRMVLVGLGIDHRARRMVKFLADAGIEIDVLTFHVFERDGQQFIARHVDMASGESVKSSGRGKRNREAAKAQLLAVSEELGVGKLFAETRECIHQHLRTRGLGWPNKGGVTFYKPSWAEGPQGKERSYAGVLLDPEVPGRLTLLLTYRAVREGGATVGDFLAAVSARETTHVQQRYVQHEFDVTDQSWPSVREKLIPVLHAIADGVDRAEQTVLAAEA